ncbi:hypothetical protein HY486_01110 [Candidatus Woesearchaeota archaeon]|nr:hypothetical protein [Candidatus Woesearchaeota archaeon]
MKAFTDKKTGGLLARERVETLEAGTLYQKMLEEASPELKQEIPKMFMRIYRGNVRKLSELTGIEITPLEQLRDALLRENTLFSAEQDEERFVELSTLESMLRKAKKIKNVGSRNIALLRVYNLAKDKTEEVRTRTLENVRWDVMNPNLTALRVLKHFLLQTGTYNIGEALDRDTIARFVPRIEVQQLGKEGHVNCDACGARITREAIVHHYHNHPDIQVGKTGIKCARTPYELVHGASAPELEIIAENLKRATELPEKYCIVKDPAYLRKVLSAKEEMEAMLAAEFKERRTEQRANLYLQYVQALQELKEAVEQGHTGTILRMLQHEGSVINTLEEKANGLDENVQKAITKYKHHAPLTLAERALVLAMYNNEIRHSTGWYLGGFSKELRELEKEGMLEIISRTEDETADKKLLKEKRSAGMVVLFKDRYDEAVGIMAQPEITVNDYLKIVNAFPGVVNARTNLQERVHEKFHENPDEVYLTVFNAMKLDSTPRAIKRSIEEAYTCFTVGRGCYKPNPRLVIGKIYFEDLKQERAKPQLAKRKNSRIATISLLEQLESSGADTVANHFAEKLFELDKWHYKAQLDDMENDGLLGWFSDRLWLANIKTTVKGAIPASEYRTHYQNMVSAYRVLQALHGPK